MRAVHYFTVVGLVTTSLGINGATHPAHAQSGRGIVQGTVTLDVNSDPVHGAVVLIIGPGQIAITDEQGRFEITDVPAGTYEILAQREHLTATRQTVTVQAEQVSTVDFSLSLSPVHEEITVTANTGGPATAFEAFNAVTTLDSFDLATDIKGTIGEALENEPGVARRSFGPGSSRPIIRGFDGDRVLIMEDGIRTGDLSSQSGDHGVTIDPGSLERLEIVRGPATLLYGSNAVGGVVNAITPHQQLLSAPSQGLRGQVTGGVGSADSQAGGNASFQHGEENWMVWGGGGGRRSEDYDTPLGPVENSATRLTNGRAGVGYSRDRVFVSAGVTVEDGRHGIPEAGRFDAEGRKDNGLQEEVFIDLASRRQVGRVDVGMRSLNNHIFDSFRVTFNVIDWQHDEIEIDEGIESVGTTFNNRTYIVRGELDQQQTALLSGKIGFWTQWRDYVATGEEALAPPTDQTSFAAFAYEEMDFGRYRLQFGGRVEFNDYRVAERAERLGQDEGVEGAETNGVEPPVARDRSFASVSGSIGLHADLGAQSAFVVNLTRSHRAPALEELYNFGPHVGNLTFDVGNSDLDQEGTTGLDVSIRHNSSRARGNLSFYVYDIDRFVFQGFTGQQAGGLRVAEFVQGDSRFVGFDAMGSVRLHEYAWVNVGLGFVEAELSDTNEPLPRIPPFRSRVSLDLPYRGLTVTPEWVFAAKRENVFGGETTTDSYALFNVKASYVLAQRHAAHIFSVTGYNITDELYRNHTSFIKDLAPEIGRGVKFSYSLRYF